MASGVAALGAGPDNNAGAVEDTKINHFKIIVRMRAFGGRDGIVDLYLDLVAHVVVSTQIIAASIIIAGNIRIAAGCNTSWLPSL